eukprot:1058884-Alexandrium_andersonii.AAC.1
MPCRPRLLVQPQGCYAGALPLTMWGGLSPLADSLTYGFGLANMRGGTRPWARRLHRRGGH